jgi:RNA polymerase sigma-70 factor, ECF subfamily
MAAWTSSTLESAFLPSHAATDENADFRALVERNTHFAFRIANGVLRSREDAEDAVQEVFLKLYRTGAWKRMEDEKAFLARTVWREAIDRLPKREQETLAAQHDDLASHADSPEASAMQSNQRALLRSLIDNLDEDLRQPLILSALDELNSRQIAHIMGIPEGTVRTRLQRARTELKRQFDLTKGASQ